jgi:hypothetical protein
MITNDQRTPSLQLSLKSAAIHASAQRRQCAYEEVIPVRKDGTGPRQLKREGSRPPSPGKDTSTL